MSARYIAHSGTSNTLILRSLCLTCWQFTTPKPTHKTVICHFTESTSIATTQYTGDQHPLTWFAYSPLPCPNWGNEIKITTSFMNNYCIFVYIQHKHIGLNQPFDIRLGEHQLCKPIRIQPTNSISLRSMVYAFKPDIAKMLQTTVYSQYQWNWVLETDWPVLDFSSDTMNLNTKTLVLREVVQHCSRWNLILLFLAIFLANYKPTMYSMQTRRNITLLFLANYKPTMYSMQTRRNITLENQPLPTSCSTERAMSCRCFSLKTCSSGKTDSVYWSDSICASTWSYAAT